MLLRQNAREALKHVLARAGFALRIARIPEGNADYEPVFPTATYAPWLADSQFKKAYGMIEPYTLVDKYRCFELWQLVAQTADLDGALIEVGVWRGGTGALIAERNRIDGRRDSVYLCDTFSGVVKTGSIDSMYSGGEHNDTSMEIVQKVLRGFGLTDTKILMGMFPEETGSLVDDSVFRFCHIDVDVYQSAKDVLEWTWPKLVVGGIVVFDDYGFQSCVGITQLVNEERMKKDRLVVHNLNGHAVMIKQAK